MSAEKLLVLAALEIVRGAIEEDESGELRGRLAEILRDPEEEEPPSFRARLLAERLRETHEALNDFADGKLRVLVATDVAARGIHVDDVEVVVHFDPPAEHKTYLHRSGRTARAGGKGLVVTLVLWNEELEVRRMQKRVGLDLPIVEMFSNDDRLSDLTAWDPTA